MKKKLEMTSIEIEREREIEEQQVGSRPKLKWSE